MIKPEIPETYFMPQDKDRSSDGVLLGLNASGPIGPMIPGSAESYRNLHYDLKVCLNTIVLS